ncbi:hypothetical protein V8G54_027886 [Vigna mungo]|uniref:Uncharacterized protein n=1 Tax=Vigna mungo TaxID=3915 RepID=A0AAQ3MRD6_VIGMU
MMRLVVITGQRNVNVTSTLAVAQIEDLERDLLLLQKELTCFEHEKWPDICCGVLSERISQLDVAIRTLKNDCADEAEVQLLLDSEPAGTRHEILAQPLLTEPPYLVISAENEGYYRKSTLTPRLAISISNGDYPQIFKSIANTASRI